MIVRLQKILSEAGIASRRKCEDYIIAGRVKVNGKVITELGSKADPNVDLIEFDNKPVIIPGKKTYIMLNKPSGYITSLKDPEQRPVITELLEGLEKKVFPVGRLDFKSEGLILLTNDGILSQRLTHPRYKIEKEYLIWCLGKVSSKTANKLAEGIYLDDGFTLPAKVQIIDRLQKETLLKIIIKEGRKRQIRRMMEAQGHIVKRLVRIRIGPIVLKRLKPGQWRNLKLKEVSLLYKATGL